MPTAQAALPHPARSALRKRSLNTTISNQIQMIQKKKTRNAQKTWPSPKVASIAPPLVVAGAPHFEATTTTATRVP